MCITDLSRARSRLLERGVSFIEMIIFIVIVSIAVAGVLLVLNNTTLHSGDPQLRKQALAIAESLLEEIELARFTYCVPTDSQAKYATTAVFTTGVMGAQPVGSSNALGNCSTAALVQGFGPTGGRPYGNVVNYVSGLGTGNSTTYSTTANTLTDVNGGAIPNLVGTFSANVAISSGTGLGGTAYSDPGANPAIPGALLITVTVTYPQGVIVLDGYRTQYAPQYTE